VKRADIARLRDIRVAAATIVDYIERSDADGDLVFDAIRMRLVEIGEAVKDVAPSTLARESSIPWSAIAGMRDKLTHRYFDTEHGIVFATARIDIPPLLAAVDRLIARG
jgi:uncharacterized protein with HEPN domain